MAVVTPSATVRPVDGGLSTVDSPTRRLGLAGLSVAGAANATLHTADPQAAIAAFGGGELVEAALHVLRNSTTRPVALDLVRIEPSEDGRALAVSAARAGSPPSTGTLVTTGSAPVDAYEVRIVSTAAVADAASGDGEFQLSLDGGDSYSNRIAIPPGGVYVVPGAGITLTFAGALDEGDAFAFDCVGPGYSAENLGAALDALDADGYDYRKLYVLGTGATAAGSAALAATVLAHANARSAAKHFMRSVVQAKHGLVNGTVTLGGDPVATEPIAVSGTPADPAMRFVVEITATGDRGAGVFRWSSDNGATWTETVTITASTGVNVLGTSGVTVTFGESSYTDGNEYTWAPRVETDAEVKAAFDSVEGWRLAVAAGEVELESSLNKGRKYRRGLIYSALLKDAENPLHHDMGRVRDGVLKGVSRLYRDERLTPGLDEAKFITATTQEGKPGKFYITQGNTRAPDGSDFDLTQLVDILNEGCRITQVYLNELPGDHLRTKPDGTIADEDAELIDSQLQVLLDAGIGAEATGATQMIEAKVRRDLPFASTRKVAARVRMVPLFYVKQAEGEVGFAMTLTSA